MHLVVNSLKNDRKAREWYSIWKNHVFFLFCNFFDDENKKIKKTFYKRQKKISFFLGFINTVMWGSAPRLEPSILAMKNCKINFWHSKSILHCDRFFLFSLIKLPQCQNFGSHFILFETSNPLSFLPKWRVIS